MTAFYISIDQEALLKYLECFQPDLHNYESSLQQMKCKVAMRSLWHCDASPAVLHQGFLEAGTGSGFH